MSGRPVSLSSPLNLRILAALRKHGPMHSYALAELVECSRKSLTTKDYLPALHAAKLIHIKRWIRAPELMEKEGYGEGRGEPSRIYAIGEGEDAPRPRPHTNAENTKRQKRRNPERFTRQKIRRRGLASVDPILAALVKPQGVEA